MWGQGLATGSWLGWRRTAAAVLLVLLFGGTASGCGDAGAKENSDVTIAVTSRGYPDEELLREIYAQALESAGFEVRRRDDPNLLPAEELEEGQISGYPDHLETVLTEATPTKLEDVPDSTRAAYREAKGLLKGMGLVPFPPAPFRRTIVVGISSKTAKARDLKSLSDLGRQSRKMGVWERELYCHGRTQCLGGLENNYGITFKSFFGVSLHESPSLLYRAVRRGKTDTVILTTTEGRLARRKRWLALLEDDQHRLPASNALWLTSQKVIDEAGPGYERAILAAQKGLTLDVMRKLNAAIELEGKAPGAVAAEYLQSIDDAR